MFAIGSKELEACPPTREDEMATCPKCGELHPIGYGEEVLKDGTKIPSRMLAFVKCGSDTYLVAINGKVIN